MGRSECRRGRILSGSVCPRPAVSRNAHLQIELSAVERFNLVNDMWAATLAGLSSMSAYLDFLQLFREASDHNVWAAILGSCHYLYRLLDPQQRPGLQAQFRTLLGP